MQQEAEGRLIEIDKHGRGIVAAPVFAFLRIMSLDRAGANETSA
jgi:hypothetical protein